MKHEMCKYHMGHWTMNEVIHMYRHGVYSLAPLLYGREAHLLIFSSLASCLCMQWTVWSLIQLLIDVDTVTCKLMPLGINFQLLFICSLYLFENYTVILNTSCDMWLKMHNTIYYVTGNWESLEHHKCMHCVVQHNGAHGVCHVGSSVKLLITLFFSTVVLKPSNLTLPSASVCVSSWSKTARK